MIDKIKELHRQGKTYREIANEVGCSIGKVCMYCGRGQLEKSRKRNRDNYKPKLTKKLPVKLDTPEARKIRMLKHRYNLTEEEYNTMYKEQKGCCKICKTPKKLGGMKGLQVDHDHSTGEVRGLLCRNCNSGIGKLGEDVEVLKNAISYLTDLQMIPKDKLEDCKWYKGIARNTRLALWDKKEGKFIHIGYSFGYYKETIEHFEDVKETRFDGFIPVEKVDMVDYEILHKLRDELGY